MQGFDISPYALPGERPGELIFEEPRDIRCVCVRFVRESTQAPVLSYLQQTWPDNRHEQVQPDLRPFHAGWFPIDDAYNAPWRIAATACERIDQHTVCLHCLGLSAEFPECAEYDVRFRRTLGIRISDSDQIERLEVYTTADVVTRSIRVQIDADTPAPVEQIGLSAWNATILEVHPLSGLSLSGGVLTVDGDGPRLFTVRLRTMAPAHPASGDGGLVTFDLGHDRFTVSLEALQTQGPIWYADQRVFVTDAAHPAALQDYIQSHRNQRTVTQAVSSQAEQSLSGALNGQPHPHPVAFSVGCQYARQRYWIEPNGDVVLMRANVATVPASDTPRYRNSGDARMRFRLDEWVVRGRWADPTPAPIWTISREADGLVLDQTLCAVPLLQPIDGPELRGDSPTVCLIGFRCVNTTDRPLAFRLPIGWSQDSARSNNRLLTGRNGHDDTTTPHSYWEALQACAGDTPESYWLLGSFDHTPVLRAAVRTGMSCSPDRQGICFHTELAPGAECSLLVQLPYLALDTPEERSALIAFDLEPSVQAVRSFWRRVGLAGAQVHTPDPRLNAVYRAHLWHTQISDFTMPNEPWLINTSVGTSTYPNFSDESCMIIQELDQRGLHDQARRRLEVWLRYQGTRPLIGRFTDHDGVFYGAGGYECGDTYNQHHGWVLWCLAHHYFITGDVEWITRHADALLRGVDWVFRQRALTRSGGRWSRGWERGFLPAGSLEDVTDFYYWLSTNAFTWRGVEWVARALEAIGHDQAGRVRTEADAYRDDLIRGFTLARQHSPLVRLRDGRWVPHFPSRLYRRGRDVGWIRETLEGAVNLLISGLFEPDSREAQWILDDYQDNRYIGPPFGYPFADPGGDWYDLGGFCPQPCLLAGLMPHLERDEPEVALWMLFNAWSACCREEITGMVEHPAPVLGFSNAAHFKTSDEANAVMWLRYLFVFAADDALRLGWALPRHWFTDGQRMFAHDVATRFGRVSIGYESRLSEGVICADAALGWRRPPSAVIVRFRHPDGAPVQRVTVNGAPHDRFDPDRGDVDVSGYEGRLQIAAWYEG